MCKIPKLFELMQERKVSPKVLSEVIDVSTGNISDWKSGRSKPSAEKLSAIASYFSVTTGYLLGIEIKNKPLTERERLIEECNKIMDNLPKDLQEVAMAQLRSLAALSDKNQKK